MAGILITNREIISNERELHRSFSPMFENNMISFENNGFNISKDDSYLNILVNSGKHDVFDEFEEDEKKRILTKIPRPCFFILQTNSETILEQLFESLISIEYIFDNNLGDLRYFSEDNNIGELI
jgi:hypothetical protein